MGEPHPEVHIPAALDWVYEATLPPLHWLLDRPEGAAREVMARWMARPSSEAFIGRLVMMRDGGRPVGGFIALRGGAVAAYRRADTMSLLAETARGARPGLVARLRTLGELHPPLESDVCYLSRLGIVPSERGRGRARVLIQAYLAQGRAAGFEAFALHVDPANAPARHLYESAGFSVTAARQAAHGLRTLTMTLAARPG